MPNPEQVEFFISTISSFKEFYVILVDARQPSLIINYSKVMIKDLLVSFTDNIKSKTTNPFFGTLILVWIFHNWRLMYSLFNFDKYTTLADRKIFLAEYLDSKVFIPNLLQCVVITIIVLITTYCLLNLSRLIVNFFEKVITPRVYKWTDISSIILKSDYELLKMDRDRAESRYEQERESRLKLQNEYELLEKKLQISLSIKEPDENTKVESLEKKDSKYIELLENADTLKAFRKIVDVVLNKRYIPDSSDTDLMLRLNLVEKSMKDYGDNFQYVLTNEGQKLRNLLIEYDIRDKVKVL